MRRPPEEHLRIPFRVHDLASDFELLDVWRYPVEISAEVPFERFVDFLHESQRRVVEGGGAAAALFRLRAAMGRVFGWDEDKGQAPLPIPGCIETSVRERLGAQDAAAAGDRAGSAAFESFSWVYQSDDENLLEISNATVHALLHLGREPLAADRWAPQMAVYVKPRGLLGRCYMTLIGPFRHGIVYPAMMRNVERGWPVYAREHGLAAPKTSQGAL